MKNIIASLALITALFASHPSRAQAPDTASFDHSHAALTSVLEEVVNNERVDNESQKETFETQLSAFLHKNLKETPYQHSDLVDIVAGLYHEESYAKFWHSSLNSSDIEERIRKTLLIHGLALDDRPAIEDIRLSLEGTTLPFATKDVAITICLVDAGMRLRRGPMKPSLLWKHWNEGDTPGAVSFDEKVSFLENKIEPYGGLEQVSRFLEGFIPKNWIYTQLLKEFSSLRNTAREQDKTFISLKPLEKSIPIKTGVYYSDAALLAQRLESEGWETGHDGSDQVTASLAQVFLSFQNYHNLQADQYLGSDSFAILNERPTEKLNAVWLNLNRARLIPDNLGNRFVMVNIPSGKVHGYQTGAEGISMRVVFGKDVSGKRTPLFRDILSQVVFRPYWNVPNSIAENEIYPKAARDSAYLWNQNFELVENFGPNQVAFPNNFESVEKLKTGTIKVRQKPGPNNALGIVKFLCPNQHSVYLHDSPADHLFSRSERDFSHGCIRLEDPAKFAHWVLGPQGWNQGRVSKALASGNQNSVNIENPIPVLITYFTVFPDPEMNRLRRYFDIYDRDEKSLDRLISRVLD